MPGSKSATTTSSRHHRYDPGADVSYKFVTRTFSRQGRRPATSPARIKHAGSKKKQPSPEDIIALAQSPSPSLIQDSYGGSLLMLRQGAEKVRPGKFLRLQKLMNEPSPIVSPRSTVSTPRFVKTLIARAKTAESSGKSSMSQFPTKLLSKETQYDYRSQISKRSASSTVRSKFTGLQHSDSWETSRDPSSSRSFTKIEDFPVRCVRCSAFPDIQIEGHSLSRILTDTNVLMAKEHCEVLGAGSCPDCIRARSQKQHESRCSKNTPAMANDVYKIALIHERSPHLTKREVQRKLFDGEISDKILNLPLWNQNKSLPITNYETQIENDTESHPEKRILPDIHSTDATRQRSTKLLNSNTFETIYEASENDLETEDKSSTKSGVLEETDKTNEMVYQKHRAEKLQKILVVPASEAETEVLEDNAEPSLAEMARSQSQPIEPTPIKMRHVEKVEAANQTERTASPSVVNPKLKQRCFTVNVVPSNNFFFDIADLAQRLRHSGVIRTKAQSKNQAFQLLSVHQISPNPELITDKFETDSNASNDSTKSLKPFNMAYEPPVFSNYRRGYLGLSSATSRTSSSVA